MGLGIREQGAGLFEELPFLACGGLVAKLCPTLATPWTVACQAPLNMGILQARILKRVAISFSRNFEGKVGFSDQVDIWGI